jgi:putative phosphoesterase
VRIGVVSDTHGYVDARLLALFAGVDAIIHGGDIGGRDVLNALAAIAPLYAVEGNNDVTLGLGLPQRLDLELGGCRIHVVHQVIEAAPVAGTNVVVFGHSHQPLAEHRDGVLYLNAGAAGRRGFHRVQTAALLEVGRGRSEARLVELGPREALRPAARVKS